MNLYQYRAKYDISTARDLNDIKVRVSFELAGLSKYKHCPIGTTCAGN